MSNQFRFGRLEKVAAASVSAAMALAYYVAAQSSTEWERGAKKRDAMLAGVVEQLEIAKTVLEQLEADRRQPGKRQVDRPQGIKAGGSNYTLPGGQKINVSLTPI